MLNSTFIEIIRTFDKEELKRFDSFLNSPYFNTRNYTIKLFDEIKKYAPDFISSELEKEKLWEKLFPGKEYNYGIMKNIIFDLTKFAEKFLEIEKFSSDEKLRMYALLDKLTDKNLYNLFMLKYNSFEKKHFRSSKIHESYFKDYTELMNRLQDLGGLNVKFRKKGLVNEKGEAMILDFLFSIGFFYNHFYISETEFNEVDGGNFIRAFSKKLFDKGQLDECAKFLEGSSEKNYRVMQVMLKLMKSYFSPHDINAYHDLRDSINENSGYFDPGTLRNLYSCLVTALDNCEDVKKFNKDNEFFEIFKKLIKHNIYTTETGKVEPTLFLSSVKTAAKLKQPEFIETVMKNYLQKISPELRDNMRVYGNVYLHYSRNEFDETLTLINKINIDTHPMKFNLKNLQILVSYEKNDYEMFLYLKDSYKHFLSKNKSVSEIYKESSMKFMGYTDSLFKLKESGDKKEMEYLKKTINEDIVLNKQWLLEKIDKI